MGDTDNNFRSYCDVVGLAVQDEVLEPAYTGSYDDVLKLSHAVACTFSNGIVQAGDAKENALYANRMCDGVSVVGYTLVGGKQCSIVVKGGCRDMRISARLLPHRHAKYDVQWDGYSDQSRKHSTGVLNLCRLDAKPVRVAFGRWHLPELVGGPYEIMWRESAKLHAWNLWRDVCAVFGNR